MPHSEEYPETDWWDVLNPRDMEQLESWDQEEIRERLEHQGEYRIKLTPETQLYLMAKLARLDASKKEE